MAIKCAVINSRVDEHADWAVKHRWMFIEHEAADKLGLFQATPVGKA